MRAMVSRLAPLGVGSPPADGSLKGAKGKRSTHPWQSPRPAPRHLRLPATLAGALSDSGSLSSPSMTVAKDVKVVGCGGVGIDYLASVAQFPKPDEKLRTQALQVQGGGNAGNAMTAAARLGLKPTLISKIGDDALGEQIVQELEAVGVDTSHILQAEGYPSPFTYIIVDREGGTRTCIHTPGDPLRPAELTPELLDGALQDAKLVYFDGRLTEGALLVAKRAKELQIPLLVEAERLRPRLDELLLLADYVTTSSHFPHDWTGEQHLGDAMLTMMARLPNAKFMATTLGSKGSVLLERSPSADAAQGGGVVLQDYLETCFQEVSEQLEALDISKQRVDAIGAGNVPIRSGVQVTSPAPMLLTLKRGADAGDLAQQTALAAAQRAAKNNADFANHKGYLGSIVMDANALAFDGLCADVIVASAAVLDKEAVFDTTGSGDAYNGTLIYGLVTGMTPGKMLRLASLVAAANCTALGARLGLPVRENIRPDVL